MYHSFNSNINFLHFLPLCKNVNHLKSLKSLLILHGLIERKGLLGELLKACFHLGALDLALSTFNTIRKPSVFLQNLVIRGLSNHGLHEHVLSLYLNCRISGCPSDHFTFPFVIKASSALGAFGIGKEIHCAVLRSGYGQNVVIQTALVDFYAKNGYMRTACALVDRIPQPDLVSWNALLAGYSFHGCDHKCFQIFKHIFSVGLRPNLSTLASIIPVCTRSGCLDIGRSLHGFAVKSGHLVNNFLVPALISMYASDMHLSAARNLFNSVMDKNVAVCNAIISAYVQKQMPVEAFEIFREMHHSNVQPNSVTFVSIIPSCEVVNSVWLSEFFHACVLKHGSENHVSVLTALVSMYAKLGDINKAKFIFERIPNRNILSWNAMVSGYVHNGLWDASLETFCEMQLCGFIPDAVSIVSILSACSKLEAILLGKSAHAYSFRKGINSNLNVANALLAFYSDCNQLAYPVKLFLKMDSWDSVSWNTIISGCVHGGEFKKAADFLHQLQRKGLAMDLVTLISILPIYCDSENLGQGMTLHGYAIKNGFASDVSLVNAFISMYCKCGDPDAGRLIFENMSKRCVVSWNALIGGIRHYNLKNEVLILFRRMIMEGKRPNCVTLINLLPVCCSQLQGKSIHAFAIRTGILQETHLLTSLISMYARFLNANLSLLIFEMNEKRDVSLWNAIFSGLIQTKCPEKAIALFRDLLLVGLQPDHITVLSLISAFSQLNSLRLAHSVMAYVIHKGFDKDVVISNALIDLYARCGNILAARKIFEGMPEKDAVSWSVMINGFGLHGNGQAALELFSQMQFSGVRPDDFTYSSILSACSHAGLVEQGWMVFNSMVEQGMSPKIEHFACMVDLLSRTGNLKEAYGIVQKLPCKPSISLLESLLGACKIHGEVEVGEKISGMLFEMDPENSETYVMLSNIYAAAGRWIDADRVRCSMEARQLRKAAGFSFQTVE
ncbi:pentatricopeptide repeat-containing protein At1g06140, mitochondrial [Manihot esculenta]|uniref:Uncharacterized protein n=1 Tax=Manihot esculenta TaxID=3983 RepID=A0ACB7GLJ2_MANES|nr:pentatricopeptide repeat-containing protein At1g06140, mitochondrial [Manihot esculenta]KAG8641237.1 hypothetical protein MANES_13G125000v8 [Manihot esculenta]